jgi:hypothetical protein
MAGEDANGKPRCAIRAQRVAPYGARVGAVITIAGPYDAQYVSVAATTLGRDFLVVTSHTPPSMDRQVVRIARISPEGVVSARRAVRSVAGGSPFEVAVAASGERVAVAWVERERALYTLLGGDLRALGAPMVIADRVHGATGPALVATGWTFLAGYARRTDADDWRATAFVRALAVVPRR